MNEGCAVVRDVIVPDIFLKDPAGFGGTASPEGRRGDLVIREGRVTGLQPAEAGPAPRLVLPWPVEAHCHLDKCHTGPRLGPVGGDLGDAIQAQMADKALWTEEDLRARASRGLREAMASGCRLIRTHVDWEDDGRVPLAWDILGDMGLGIEGLTLQRAALTSAHHLVERGADIARHIAATGGILGLFVLDQPQRDEAVRLAFELAERFGLALDFHVDEGLGDGLDGLELIADEALRTGFGGPVLCGHACSLMNREGDDLDRLLEKLARSTIHVCSLPTTNLYLQGRQAGTPDRRGITRLRELHGAGVPIIVGSDNVADAFCPTGQHDPVAALNLAVLGAHLDPPLGRWLASVTLDAARALGHDAVQVDGAPVGQLALAEGDASDLLSGRAGALTPLASCVPAASGLA
jgi:cytosine deaminase